MPMETSAVGIRPVSRPSAPGNVDSVGRRGGEDTSAGFRPQTNVSIENAIEDMAGILSKISTAEMETVDKMPEDLQKVIENVMKQAFSFDETIGSGLGSTMESQRFSMEQLTSVARTLLQMSALAEKGYDVNFSDGLQKLLSNLKLAVTQEPGGQAFEPVLLLKAAFGLINGKEASDLPQALQQFLSSMQAGGGQSAAQPQTEAMAFLKSFVQYLMPRGEAAAQSMTQGQAQLGAQGQTTQGTSAQASAGGMAAAEGQAASGTPAAQGGAAATSQPQMAQGAQGQAALSGELQGQAAEGQASNTQGQAALQGQPAASGNPAEVQTILQGQASENTAASAQSQPQGAANAANASTTASAEGNADVPASPNPNGNPQVAQSRSGTAQAGETVASQMELTEQAGQNEQTAAGTGKANAQAQAASQEVRQASSQPAAQDAMQNMTMTAREAKEFLMSQPLQNTPEAMQMMKQLARFFLEQGDVSPKDAQALQAFADSGNSAIPTKEARQLETLLRVVQQNIPATVQQAAVQQNLPALPRLWAFMQLADLSTAKRLNTRQLKKAAKDVAEFVFSMRGSMEGDHAVQQGQRSMNFMMPLYLGENEKSYPAYIHVYDETQQDQETGLPKKETWLRLCVLTENLGAVELTCRVYEQQHLDMRIIFANQEASQEFRAFVPELRKSMRGSKLKLEDVAVGAPGNT